MTSYNFTSTYCLFSIVSQCLKCESASRPVIMNLHVDHRFKLYRLGLGELAEDDVPQGAGGLVHHHVHVSVHLQEDLLAHPTLEEVQIV